MEERKFDLGKTFKFRNPDEYSEYVVFKFEDENETHYRGLLLETNVEHFEIHVGKPNTAFWKRGKVIKHWDYILLSEELDPYGKNVRLKYDDPDVIDIYINMALDTGDKRWFNFLAKKKLEVSA